MIYLYAILFAFLILLAFEVRNRSIVERIKELDNVVIQLAKEVSALKRHLTPPPPEEEEPGQDTLRFSKMGDVGKKLEGMGG